VNTDKLSPASGDELGRYLSANRTLDATRSQIDALEQTEAVETFHRQLALLRRRLLSEPQAFRDIFIADGTEAMVWEFQQDELGPAFSAPCGH